MLRSPFGEWAYFFHLREVREIDRILGQLERFEKFYVRIAGQAPGVLGLDKCFVRNMGFNYYAVLHIVVKGELSVREGHRIAHQVEDEVLRALPEVSEVLVHVEPEEELVAEITADHR